MKSVSVLGGLLAWIPAGAQQMTLDYACRYDCQFTEHVMGVTGLSGGRALVASSEGLDLIDLDALPVGGTQNTLGRVTGIEARDVYLTPDEQYAFVNTHRGSQLGNIGFDVVKLAGNSLTKVLSFSEPGVLYEKMALDGGYLYVAAHAHGLRIFDVSDPEQPALVGQLEQGFVDAFAVAVAGNTAYVADGAGGLKLVDVADRQAPAILAGETLATAVGTYEDVTVRDGRVFAAAGGAGLAVYEQGQLSTRTLHAAGACAESLCWVGEHLAVGSLDRTTVFAVGAGTGVTPVASEHAHRRGSEAALRLVEGVGAASGDRVLVADWNYVDVYELKPAAQSAQPDIDCDVQRIRFAPGGGSRTVTVTNGGQGTLSVSSVQVSNPGFDCSWAGGDLAPSQSVAFEITYQGGGPAGGTGLVLFASNDPDENPLPIQVFGNTNYLDPGDPAPDFTLQTLERDSSGQVVAGAPFSLSGQQGKVVWFATFGTW